MDQGREEAARILIKYKLLIGGEKFIGELLEEIDSLRESNTSLREAIRIYGGHCGGCRAVTIHMTGTENPIDFPAECQCGFREVYKKAIKENVGTENHIDAIGVPGSIRGSK